MRRSNGYRLFMAIAVLASPAACRATGQRSNNVETDVLIPQKGHPLFGTLQSATDKAVIFTTDSDATTKLSWDKIKEIQIHHKTVVQAKKRLVPQSPARSLTLENPTIQQAQGILTFSSPGHNLILLERSIVSISPPAKPAAVAWAISITPSASLSTGTQTQQTLGAKIRVKREQGRGTKGWHHQATTLTLDANDSLTEQVGTSSIRTHEYYGALGHSVYLSDNLYMNVLAEGYHNTSLNLYLEQSYGGGLGKRVFENVRNELWLSTDFLYIAEHFYGTVPSVSFAGARPGENYTLKIADLQGGPLEVTQSGSYTAALNQRKAWQARGAVALSVPVNKSLTANLSFFDDYLENAPNGRKNYTTSSFGLTYTFSRPK